MSIALRYMSREARRLIIAGTEPAWLTRHPRYSYLRAAYLSLPDWMDRDELRWIHWCKNSWSAVMGREYVLDHIIPLNHPHVCGLTVPANLRLVPRIVNGSKGAQWHPDQLELTYEEQL